jgi:hypothetical protein
MAKIPLDVILKYREELLEDYAIARKTYLAAKEKLQDINNILDNHDVENYNEYDGDFDLWLDLHCTSPQKSLPYLNS